MKKRSAKLTKSEQEKVEADYHNMDPHEFDAIMSRASLHRRDVKSHSNQRKKLFRREGV